MNKKLESLQGIIKGVLGYDWNIVESYDFTQPDGVDESGSGGVWDLAGIIADKCLENIYENENVDDMDYQITKDSIQALLYNLFCDYKDEQEQ